MLNLQKHSFLTRRISKGTKCNRNVCKLLLSACINNLVPGITYMTSPITKLCLPSYSQCSVGLKYAAGTIQKYSV